MRRLLTRAGHALAVMALLATAVSFYGGRRPRNAPETAGVRTRCGRRSEPTGSESAGRDSGESLWDTAAGVSGGARAANAIGAGGNEMAGGSARESIETMGAAGGAVAGAALVGAVVPAWRGGAVDRSAAIQTG